MGHGYGKAFLVFTFLLGRGSSSEVLKVNDFEGQTLGFGSIVPYTVQNVVDDFGYGDYGVQGGSFGIMDHFPSSKISISPKDHWATLGYGNVFKVASSTFFQYWGAKPDAMNTGNALVVAYEKGKLCKEKAGASWRHVFTGRSEVVFSYEIFIPEDFDYQLTGKIPGLCGGSCNTGGQKTDGTGYSVRFLWHGLGDSQADGARYDGTITAYIYHRDQPRNNGVVIGFCEKPVTVDVKDIDPIHGTFCPAGNEIRRMRKGHWNHLQMRMRLNSSRDLNDGELVVWLNHEYAGKVTGIRFWDAAQEVKIDRMLFDTCFGGSDDWFRSPKDNYLGFDRFVLSTDVLKENEWKDLFKTEFQIENVYPNPVRAGDALKFQSYAEFEKVLEVQVFDLSGNLILSEPYFAPKGRAFFYWPTHPNLQAGMYLLRVRATDSNQSTTMRIQIL